jgi:hypothetical protein
MLTLPAVIHLYVGGGVVHGNKVFFKAQGTSRHDNQNMAPCGKLTSVDITDNAGVVYEDVDDPDTAKPAAFLVDIDKAYPEGHKLCGLCIHNHGKLEKESFPAYMRTTDLDRATYEEDHDEQAEPDTP